MYVHTLDDAKVKTDLTERGRERRAKGGERGKVAEILQRES